ncbi:hypothetical protein T492DRAFT_877819, partial [Pavlovales sp. CCMP2436]
HAAEPAVVSAAESAAQLAAQPADVSTTKLASVPSVITSAESAAVAAAVASFVPAISTTEPAVEPTVVTAAESTTQPAAQPTTMPAAKPTLAAKPAIEPATIAPAYPPYPPPTQKVQSRREESDELASLPISFWASSTGTGVLDLETGRASFCQGRAGDKIIRLEIIDNESIASALKQSLVAPSPSPPAYSSHAPRGAAAETVWRYTRAHKQGESRPLTAEVLHNSGVLKESVIISRQRDGLRRRRASESSEDIDAEDIDTEAKSVMPNRPARMAESTADWLASRRSSDWAPPETTPATPISIPLEEDNRHLSLGLTRCSRRISDWAPHETTPPETTPKTLDPTLLEEGHHFAANARHLRLRD